MCELFSSTASRTSDVSHYSQLHASSVNPDIQLRASSVRSDRQQQAASSERNDNFGGI